METGNNVFHKAAFSRDLSLDTESIKLAHAIINLRYDGVSILITSADKKLIIGSYGVDWAPRKNTSDLLLKAEIELSNLKLNIKDCKSIHWLLTTDKFTLIPEKFYIKGKGRMLLSNTCRLDKGDLIYADIWNTSSIINVFSLPNTVVDWIKTKYHGSTFSHSSTAVNRLYKYYPKSETFALLYVNDYFAEFYAAQDGQLKFYNLFSYQIEEDLLYMVLFALEQSKILAPEIELKLAGKAIKGEKLFSLLENYMGALKPIKIPERFAVSPQIGTQEVRRCFNLLGGI